MYSVRRVILRTVGAVVEVVVVVERKVSDLDRVNLKVGLVGSMVASAQAVKVADTCETVSM